MDCICEVCGTTFHVRPSRGKVRFCSWACTAAERAQRKTTATCENCRQSFTKYASTRVGKYCSIRCSISARNRTAHNPAYNRDITGERNPMHGKRLTAERNGMYGRTGAANPAWKGGRKMRKDGYILVYQPHHPAAVDSYVLEHRLIMEQHLGRYLDPDEVVHHKDNNPGNNTLSNLHLYSNQSEHIKDAHS